MFRVLQWGSLLLKKMQDGNDGPCRTNGMQKVFWTDALKSLTLGYDSIFETARQNNPRMKEMPGKRPGFSGCRNESG